MSLGLLRQAAPVGRQEGAATEEPGDAEEGVQEGVLQLAEAVQGGEHLRRRGQGLPWAQQVERLVPVLLALALWEMTLQHQLQEISQAAAAAAKPLHAEPEKRPTTVATTSEQMAASVSKAEKTSWHAAKRVWALQPTDIAALAEKQPMFPSNL